MLGKMKGLRLPDATIAKLKARPFEENTKDEIIEILSEIIIHHHELLEKLEKGS